MEDKKIVGKTMTLCLVMALMLLLFSSPSYAIACSSDTSCPSGQVCRDDVCQNCITSAECVQKTFLKSVPGAGQASPWFTISLMAVLVAGLGAGMYFVVGYVFNIDAIKRNGKAELMQALASLILVALLFGVEAFEYKLIELMETQTGIITASMYSPSLVAAVGSSGIVTVSPFDICYVAVRKMLDCAERQWRMTLSSSIPDEMLANLQLQVQAEFGGKAFPTPIEWAWFVPSFAKRIAEKEYLADELSWLSVMLYAQLNMFRFIETSMFTMFLPIGIVLRAFPPTRGAGAVMIAIAIGLYIVFPMMYTVLYIGGPKTVQGCNVSIPDTTSVETASCPLAPGTIAAQAGSAASSSVTFSANIPVVKSGTGELRYLSYLYLLISLGGTFIFVRSISGLLGADISEIGRSMVKLV